MPNIVEGDATGLIEGLADGLRGASSGSGVVNGPGETLPLAKILRSSGWNNPRRSEFFNCGELVKMMLDKKMLAQTLNPSTCAARFRSSSSVPRSE